MLQAQEIDLVGAGIRVGASSISRIGIADNSVCWGLWVPDRKIWPDKSDYDHLLVAPFEPSSWPVLCRLQMYVKDDGPGTLASAIEPVSKHINIVWLEAVPAGHHHAILSIIGEDTTTKFGGLLTDLKNLAEDDRTFKNTKTTRAIHETLAKEMLKKSRSIEVDILNHDRGLGDKGFLREIFLPPSDPRHEVGVLYSIKHLPEEVKAIGIEQSTQAVSCKWLQNLAFFWLYGRNPRQEAIEFNYDEANKLLTPGERGKNSFKSGLQNFTLPLRSLASVHSFERFMRVILSSEDTQHRSAKVKIPYKAKFAPPFTTKGFQLGLYKALANRDISLRHVSMFTQERTLESETGELSLIASMSSQEAIANLDNFEELVSRSSNEAAALIEESNTSMICSPVRANRLVARRMFFSTKFDWMDENYSKLASQIKLAANCRGFAYVEARQENRSELDLLVPEAKPFQSITEWTTHLIRNSDAFLQIFPSSVVNKNSNSPLNWLLYEFGAAQALGLPSATLVDCDERINLEDWMRTLRVGNDYFMYEFDSRKSDDHVLGVIETALADLSNLS